MDNDKTLVIVAVTILAISSLLMLSVEAKEIITNSISGLLGLAIGQRLRSNNDNKKGGK